MHSPNLAARTKAIVGCLAISATALAAMPSASPAKPPARADRLERAIHRLTAAGAPGAIALVHDRHGTRRLARGQADLATHRRIRATDRFRIASLTKSFTATVVLQLARERRLALDDTVEHWLPGLVPDGDGITVRQLMNHTSGLFDYPDDDALMDAIFDDPVRARSPQELIAVGTAHPPRFAPGAGWSYSNTGYLVLGLIAEAASGHPLATELDARIFGPLRLRNTSFDPAPRIAGRHAHGYRRTRRLRDVSVFSPSFAWAAGGIVSTADDVARFYRALLGGRLLPREQLRTMMTTVPSDDGGAYGLGLQRVTLPCGTVWGHTGDFPGYLTAAFAGADGRRQAVVVATTDTLSDRGRRALERLGVAAYCG